MDIDISADGRMLLQCPQQQWSGHHPGLLQTSRFAGQTMTAVLDNADGFRLLYLGFQSGPFDSIAAAPQADPLFARTVLARLAALVEDWSRADRPVRLRLPFVSALLSVPR